VVVCFIGGETQSTQRNPEYTEKPRVHRETQSTQRKPEYTEKTRVHRENHKAAASH
jgi:hypothetical protein